MNETPVSLQPTIVKTTVGLSTPGAVGGTPGGFDRRFAAVFVDSLILGLALWPVNLATLFIYKFYTGLTTAEAIVRGSLFINLIDLGVKIVVVYFYYGYFYSTRGASPGKQLLGLKVLNSANGTYLTYGQAFKREVFGKYVLDTLSLGIGYLMAAFRQDKKALHDIVCETQVIKLGTAQGTQYPGAGPGAGAGPGPVTRNPL